MSHRSAARNFADHGHTEFGRGRTRPIAAASQHQAKSDWTLGHAGRQVRVRPVAFWIIVGTLVVMAGWSTVTATYFAFRDDVLTRLLARQAQMQYAYEDRIAELRGQVDRLASRQLLDQEQVESKLEVIARRQAALESNSSALSSLRDPAITGSIKSAPRAGTPTLLAPQSAPKPSPINDTVILVPPPEREARLESRTPFNSGVRLAVVQAHGGIEGALARLQVSLDRYEANQAKTLNFLEESYDAKARGMPGILAELGLDLGKVAPALPPRASGGPFVPASANGISAFERQLYRIKLVRGHVERLTRTLSAVPIRKPMMGE